MLDSRTTLSALTLCLCRETDEAYDDAVAGETQVAAFTDHTTRPGR